LHAVFEAPNPTAPIPTIQIPKTQIPTTEIPTALVELSEVGVSFDGKVTWALQNVNLQVNPGERWVVLGPNGSGKSTMVQLVSGYLHPSVGALSLFGGQLGKGVDWRKLRLGVGVMSAAFAKMVRPELTGQDVVMTAKNGALEPWWHEYDDDDRTRAYELLKAGGFGYLATREFGVCSEGERQQIQLARVLMANPKLLVLDEPAAGLDLGARERLVARMAAVAADPTVPGLVLVTHHVEEIAPGFTHALVLRKGEVVAQGPFDETLTSEIVSHAFDVNVTIDRNGGRLNCRFV
jgi:iron complex transport system ATP-binding protein